MPALRLFLTLLLLLTTISCSRDAGQSTSSVAQADAAAQTQAFSADPWLRERLPADTIAYFRVPSPWRTLFGPGGKRSDQMFQSQAYVAAVTKLRADLAKDPLSGAVAIPVTGLLYQLASPIEVAVISPGRLASPAASVYATMVFDYSDAAALGKVLGSAFGSDQPVAFDADGYAKVPIEGAPGFLHFDAASKRLSLLGGMNATVDALKAVRKSIVDGKVEPRAELALEREIDAGGHGLVLWADIEAMRPMLGGAATDEATRQLLAQTKRVALGWGSVDGQGRVGLRAEIGGAAWTAYLPQSPRKLDLKASGRTRMLFSAAVPTGDDLKRIAGVVAQNPDLAGGWNEADAKLAEISGLHIADLFAPFGPDLAAYSDDAGEFVAVRMHDAAAFERLLKVLTDKFKATHVSADHGGQQIHHLRLPGMIDLAEAMGGDAEKLKAELGAQIYARAGSHLYWIEQDGWLVLAGVPQPLMDRIELGADQPLDAYLQRAGGDPTALVSVAAEVNDAARRTYHAWLGALASIADLGGASIDLMTLPTARQLGLPAATALGASLQVSPTRLQIELNYGQHPMEWLGGGDGLTVVAVGGILAAIALPAYQDYTVRAEVATALAEASVLKVAIAEHYASSAERPSDAEALGMELPLTTANGHAEIDLDHGAIIVRFVDGAPSAVNGSYLYLVPAQSSDESIEWRCGNAAAAAEDLLVTFEEGSAMTDVADRYLPTQCRTQ